MFTFYNEDYYSLNESKCLFYLLEEIVYFNCSCFILSKLEHVLKYFDTETESTT